MQRIAVVGAVGSGKTTLGRQVAAALALPFTDLDALEILPGWRHREPADFLARAAVATAGDRWVVAGDFAGSAGAVVWPRADTVVWLDLPRAVTAWRALRRTAEQIRTGVEVYPGCVQTIRTVRESGLLRMVVRHPGKKRRTHPALLRERAAPGATVLRLRSRRRVAAWLAEVERAGAARR